MTIHLLSTLVSNGRQLNLPRGNFSDQKWLPWLCKSEKRAITRERKLLSEIRQLKTFGVQRRFRW